MTDIVLMKTTDYRLTGDTETWNLALGNADYTRMTADDLARLRNMIDEVLDELEPSKKCTRHR